MFLIFLFFICTPLIGMEAVNHVSFSDLEERFEYCPEPYEALYEIVEPSEEDKERLKQEKEYEKNCLLQSLEKAYSSLQQLDMPHRHPAAQSTLHFYIRQLKKYPYRSECTGTIQQSIIYIKPEQYEKTPEVKSVLEDLFDLLNDINQIGQAKNR